MKGAGARYHHLTLYDAMSDSIITFGGKGMKKINKKT